MSEFHEARSPRPGQEWTDPAHVAAFIHKMDGRQADRDRQFDQMCQILEIEGQPRRILDLGTGYGALARYMLDRFPSATVLGVDMSDAMMAVARERMQGYGERFQLVVQDMAAGYLDAVPIHPVDAVVSSLAIHHLPREAKAVLFGEIWRRLVPGGWFLNWDYVLPTNPVTQRIFREIRARQNGRPFNPGHGHIQPGDLPDLLELLLRQGFEATDVYVRAFQLTLYGGRRPL